MTLLTAERRLQAAQRHADVESLDALLHPRVVGVGPDGTVFTKEDDRVVVLLHVERLLHQAPRSLAWAGSGGAARRSAQGHGRGLGDASRKTVRTGRAAPGQS